MRSLLYLFSLFTILLTACTKDEPFEYPDNPEDVEPAWYTVAERTITAEEGWSPTQFTDECDPSIHINNLAYYELNYKRGFASIQLTPDSSICETTVKLFTGFKEGEIDNGDWENMKFEYTFAEYEGNENTSYRIGLIYGEAAFSIDLGPTLEELIPADENNGLFTFFVENGEPVFMLNGVRFQPLVGDFPNNYVRLDGPGLNDGSDGPGYFYVEMTSKGSSQQAYTLFKYLRIQRFGNPPS